MRPVGSGIGVRKRRNASFPAADSGSGHAKVLKLPRVGSVEILGKWIVATIERCPIAIRADDVAEIRRAELDDAREIHLVRLDDAAARVLDGPYDAGEDRRGDLEARRVVVRR